MAAPGRQHALAAVAPEPIVVGAAHEERRPSGARVASGPSSLGGTPSSRAAGRLVASLSVEELQRLLAEVVRAEVSGATGTASGVMEPWAHEMPAEHGTFRGSARSTVQGEGSAAGAMPSTRPHRSFGFFDSHELIRIKPTVRESWRRHQASHGRVSVWERVREMRGAETAKHGQPNFSVFVEGEEEEKAGQSMLEVLMSLSPLAQSGALQSWACRWARRWDWFVNDVREPLRTGPVADIVLSRTFELFFSFVIILNAIYMAAAMNYQVKHPMEGASSFMSAAEFAFVGLYCVELLFKLIVHKWFFFWNEEMRWNVLDFCLVVHGIFDLVFEASFGSSGGQSPSWLRALRLFKMAKVLRMLRVIRTFQELHLIMACILGSIQSLVWSIAMMGVILYMFSLVFVQQAAVYLNTGNASDEMDGNIKAHYGSVETTMLTLFKTLFGGDDWSIFYEIMAEVSFLTQVLFVLFVAFAQIALLNILTGIFVESALKLAEPHDFKKADEYSRMVNGQALALKDMLARFDINFDGSISREEFAEIAKDSRVQNYLRYLGIDMPSVDTFFNMLGGVDEHGNVAIDTFVDGCMRLRGEAKSIHLNQLLYEVKCLDLSKIHSAVSSMRHDLSIVKKSLEGRLNIEAVEDDYDSMLQGVPNPPKPRAVAPSRDVAFGTSILPSEPIAP